MARRVSITENTRRFEARLATIMKQTAEEIAPKISEVVQREALREFEKDPTILAMREDDSLRGQIGFFTKTERNNTRYLINYIGKTAGAKENNEIKIKGQRSGKTVIEYRLLINFHEFVDSAPDWQYIQYLNRETGHLVSLPWLKWFILGGQGIIIKGFDAVRTRNIGASRSRTGYLMKKGTSWRVPAEHAGTSVDNFVTRGLRRILDNGGPLRKSINTQINLAIRRTQRRFTRTR